MERLGPDLSSALAWIGAALTADGLAADIEQSVGRISDLVKAIKDYSCMDQAPEQAIDLHQSSRSATMDQASRSPSRIGFSTRSSQPSRWAKAPVSAWRSAIGSSPVSKAAP